MSLNQQKDLREEQRVTERRSRILFLLPSLAGGGAERNTLRLLKLLNRDSYEGYLGLVRAEGPLLQEVPTEVQIVESPPQSKQLLDWVPIPAGKGLLTTALKLRKMIRQLEPDIVVSLLPEISLSISLVRRFYRRCPFRWIVTERNATNIRLRHMVTSRMKRLILRRWIRAAYSAADHVIAVSQGVKQGLVENFGISPTNITVIHNPVEIGNIQKKANQPVSVPWPDKQVILGVGSLTTQKGFDILIQAFAQVRRKICAALLILGRGEQMAELKALTQRLGVEDYVTFAGFVSNPWAYMARANVFVLSSRWEGLPNVLLEAMACRTPVIATDCNYGPAEIITDGKDGLLVQVDDVDRLAEALCRLLAEVDTSERLRQGGYTRALEFDVTRFCSQHEDVFRRVMESRRN